MNYGTVLRAVGRTREALEAYGRAASLGEKSADFLYNVGLLHLDLGDHEAARSVLREAHALSPRDAEISFYYATACSQTLATADGLAALSDWPQLERLTGELVGKIANVLLSLGDAQSAESAVDRALADPSADPQALLQAVLALERMNRLARANAVMARLQDVAPTSLGSDYVLAHARLAQRAARHEEAIAGFRTLIAECKEVDGKYVHQYPLAKALDALGRYDEAFSELEHAHASQVAWIERTLPDIALRKSDTMRVTRFGCDAGDIARWDHAGAPSYLESPVFIVAFPRSGTTLLEQTLDAHPRLKSMDEQPYLQNAIERLVGEGVNYPDRMAALTVAQLDQARAYYWSLVARRVTLQPGEHLLDKNPLNILRLPAIARLFPNARTSLRSGIPATCSSAASCSTSAPGVRVALPRPADAGLAYRRTLDFWYQQSALLEPDGRSRSATKPSSRTSKPECATRRVPRTCRGTTRCSRRPSTRATRDSSARRATRRSCSRCIRKSVGRWRPYERHLRAGCSSRYEPYLERWGYAVPGQNSR